MTQRWGWVTTGWKMTSYCVETIFQEIQSFQPPADQSKQCHCAFYSATFFFFTWLLILSFPTLYALPVSAIKGVHGGGWDVPGGGDQGDQSDQGPQAAPHAPVPRVDGRRPSFPAAPSGPWHPNQNRDVDPGMICPLLQKTTPHRTWSFFFFFFFFIEVTLLFTSREYVSLICCHSSWWSHRVKGGHFKPSKALIYTICFTLRQWL